jgi:hypothetical protein
MGILAIVAVLLPQLLLLMIVGGYFDLLGGWNHSESGLHVLVGLFAAAPVVAVLWMIALAVSNWLGRSHGRPAQPLWPALLLLIEAIGIDLLVLSQLHI